MIGRFPVLYVIFTWGKGRGPLGRCSAGAFWGFWPAWPFNKVDLDQLKSRNFKLIMGPVICILFGLIIAYVSYQLWPGRDKSLIGWRLYAFGLLGLLAGMLLQRKRLPVDGITLAVLPFHDLYHLWGIMNLCALVISAGTPGGNSLSLESMRVLYISGVPYDAFHAGSAALCIFLFGNSIIRKLERIKIKYGIYK